jgi:hypothetical protein
MKRLRGERGANLVEFAIVLPVLLALVFGIVEFGIAFNDYISVRQGARDGARQAAVANFGTATGCSGVDTSTSAGKLICLTKTRVGLDGPGYADTKVKVIVPSPYQVGEDLSVCAVYPLDSVTGLFSPLLDGKYLKTKVTMRVEQVGTGFSSTEETYPDPGGTWSSWCS